VNVSWYTIIRSLIIKIFLVVVLVVATPSIVTAQTADEPVSIFIPSAQIKLPVKTARIAFNTWEVSTSTASYGEGSALPGTSGNTVIFAHARAGLFGTLPEVAVGELIYVFTASDWYAYRVTERLVVPPTQTDVIKNSSAAELTLFTCTGPGDSHRLVLKALLEQ
jgi:LPXTG-site transpeptidase (sortase) family protein